MKLRLLARAAAGACLLLAGAALAGGPSQACNSQGLKYPGAGNVTLNYDQGNLGPRSKAQADAIVNNAIAQWNNVSTATLSLTRGPDLPVNVTTANYATYLDRFSDGLNPVIYDSDGSIIDLVLGSGARSYVLGFAGSAYYGAPTCQYVEGQAVINGYISVSDVTLTTTIAHELGHLVGLDHTQLDSSQGLAPASYPLMYPVAYRGSVSLHEDDVASVSALYPASSVSTTYGQITGTFVDTNGAPIRGANIWAQGSAGTFSVVSDYLQQGTGYFRLLLRPGTYTLRAEAIHADFTGGSSVGPYSETSSGLSFQPPLYVNGAPMATVTFGPTITVTAGCAGTVTFRRDGSGTVSGNCGAAPPAPPSLVSPSGTVTTPTPTFVWNAVSGATSYTVLVQNTAGVALNQTVTASAAGCGAGTGTCSYTATTSLSNGTYSWFVRSSNASGTSTWSSPLGMSVSAAPPPSVPPAPTTVAPSGSTSSPTPTFVWNASAGATSYWLLVQNTSGAAINQSVSATSAGCASGSGTCQFMPSTALANGATYSWFVNASNSAGTSGWSAARSFTVGVASGPPAAPTQTAPSGTVSTVTPTFTWNASSGATSYYLLVQNTSGVAIAASYSASSLGCASGGTCSVTPGVPLTNNATYSWFVNASNSSGTSAWSPGLTLRISAAGPSVPNAPSQVSPSGTVATTMPTYTWNASAGATSYYLLVQNTSGVAVSLSLDAAAAGCAAGTGTCSYAPAIALSNGATYSWFVNASNSLGTSGWSGGLTLSVNATGPSAPAAPTLVSPNGNVATRTPTYTWNASAGATSYILLVQNTAGVAVYQALAASAAGCGPGTGTCSFTPSTALASATAYSWFVRASNSIGTSAWSAGNSIRTP